MAYEVINPTPSGRSGIPVVGFWLVDRKGQLQLVDQRHVPAEGQGFRYFYLGASPGKVTANAIGKVATKWGYDGGNIQEGGYAQGYAVKQTIQRGYSDPITHGKGFDVIQGLIYGTTGALPLKWAIAEGGVLAGAGKTEAGQLEDHATDPFPEHANDPTLGNKPADAATKDAGGAAAAGAAAGAAGAAKTVIQGVAGATAIAGLSQLSDFFTNADFWKGLGLILAGVLILAFAALEFYSISGAPAIRV